MQFDPRPQGTEANSAVFAAGVVFGIEVTIPALAGRCTVNLDHHGRQDTAETPSACEQALTCGLPETGATLATVRPDADSVTAMAVILNRSLGRGIDTGMVQAVGKFDRMGPSGGEVGAFVRAIGRKAFDFKLSLEQRVEWVADLLAGVDKSEEIALLNSAHTTELKAAREASKLSLHAGKRIAAVVSNHRYATTLGYENAPVVVAQNPEMPVDLKDPAKGTYVKYTVCRYDSHTPCDLPTALIELQGLEAGWGGRGGVFGSPQGISSTLTIEQVIEVVSRHLK